MKRILLTVAVSITVMISYAQKKETKAKFIEYTETSHYQIDGTNIVVSDVIENIPGSKENIYINIKSFFTRYYKDANSVLQTDDKEAGVIIGKGYFKDLYTYRMMGMNPSSFSAYHILRVDIKDGRIRVIVSASDWEYETKAALDTSTGRKSRGRIIDYAPITDRRLEDKGKQMEAFVALIDLMYATINELEKAVKEGGVTGENTDW